MTAIEVIGLRKAYQGHEVLCGIDLTLARGEDIALLGPNGAGKTTTVEILEGHRAPGRASGRRGRGGPPTTPAWQRSPSAAGGRD
ncbi:ATP-binding cassette domain-containing protein [Micromonospora echinospora]|uniref:ATP-binding cassette domain-containing protein n=1 Tax=Micromonospora echinospora TaxID=1877 RepID=UPI003F4D788A